MRYPRWVSKTERAKILEEKKAGKSKSAPPKKTSSKSESPDLPESAKPLYDALMKLRSRICASMGGIPVYLVFTNAVLREFALKRPKSREEAMAIKGVGEKNAKKFLQRFLDAIADFAD